MTFSGTTLLGHELRRVEVVEGELLGFFLGEQLDGKSSHSG
jgi:hypothetical protein